MRKNFEDAPYDVGYGKPPRHSRYPKGTSGNRRGRPPGSKNHLTALRRILDQKVTVIENDKRRRISKLEAAVSVQLNMAAQGNTRAFQATLKVVELLGLKPEQERPGVTFIIEE
jgi:hypothetical protein